MDFGNTAVLCLLPLFAIFQILYTTSFIFDDWKFLLRLYLILLTTIFLLYFLARLLFKIRKALFLVVILFLSFFAWMHLPDIRFRWQLLLWISLTAGLVVVVLRISEAKLLKKMLISLLVFSFLGSFISLYTGSLNSPAAKAEHRNKFAPSGTRYEPNIYFFLIDAYGRSDVLKKEMGYDNFEFIAKLKKSHFFVANKSRANYPITLLSIGSMLEMNYPLSAGPRAMSNEEDNESLYKLNRGNHRSAKFFRKHGYDYVHFWKNGGCSYEVDVCVYGKSYFGRKTRRIFKLTPLGRLIWYFEKLPDNGSAKKFVRRNFGMSMTSEIKIKHRQHDVASLRNAIDQLPRNKPFYLFSRILPPHPGNTYKEDCTYQKADRNVGDTDYSIKKYVSDVKCVERDIFSLVKYILKTDKTHPVVILVSDHGPGHRGQFDKKFNNWDRIDVTSRFANLIAIHMSKNCINKYFYHAITPVNIMRIVTACLAGKKPILLKDKSFFATYSNRPDYGKVLPVDMQKY